MNDWWKLLKNSENDWKCQLCNKYIFVFPIHSLSSDNRKFICGRCIEKKSSSIEIGEEQRLFENVAEHLRFPCSYDIFGCMAELDIFEIQSHEEECPFKNTVCPLNEINRSFLSLEEVCGWRGDNKDLVPHINKDHQKYIQQICQLTLPDNKTTLCFTEVRNHMFMVLFKYLETEDKYMVPVFSTLGEIECKLFRYQLQVWDKQDLSVVFRKDGVQTIHDRILKNTSAESSLLLDVPYLKKLLHSDNFNVKLSITRKVKGQIKSSTKMAKVKTPIAMLIEENPSQEKILEMLECVVCKYFMIPPIYLCEAGHSICNSCSSQVNGCPTCRAKMSSIRNFHLEHFAEGLKYPCKNKPFGCSALVSLRDYDKHEKNCELSKKQCVLGCDWMGVNVQMIIHLQENHKLHDIDEIITLKLAAKRQKLLKAVVRNNYVFQFVIVYASNLPLVFSLHSLSFHLRHKYEIHLLDKSDNNLDMIMNYLCPLLVIEEDGKYAKINKDEVTVPLKMIQHLIDENGEISLKLSIFDAIP